MPEISIVIPIYNTQEFLGRCVESILKQNFNSFEIILVDDGSSDYSNEICKYYCKLDNRVRLLEKNNGGVSSARNLGIENSNGEYIMFIDSDDYIDSDTLEYMYNIIKRYSAEVAQCKIKLYKNGKCSVKEYEDEVLELILGNENIINTFLLEKKLHFSASNKLYKKSLIIENKIRFNEDIRYSEDALFNHYIFLETTKVVISNQFKYNYYINGNSTISSVNEKRLDILKGIEKIRTVVIGKYPKYKGIFAQNYIRASIAIIIDIVIERRVVKKYHILKAVRNMAIINKGITGEDKEVSFKYKFLYSLMKISPMLVALIYKIRFIFLSESANV